MVQTRHLRFILACALWPALGSCLKLVSHSGTDDGLVDVQAEDASAFDAGVRDIEQSGDDAGLPTIDASAGIDSGGHDAADAGGAPQVLGNWICERFDYPAVDCYQGHVCGRCEPCYGDRHCSASHTCLAPSETIEIFSVDVVNPENSADLLHYASDGVLVVGEEISFRADILSSSYAQESIEVHLYDLQGTDYGQFDLIGGAFHFDLSWNKVQFLNPYDHVHHAGARRLFQVVATTPDGERSGRDIDITIDCRAWNEHAINGECVERMALAHGYTATWGLSLRTGASQLAGRPTLLFSNSWEHDFPISAESYRVNGSLRLTEIQNLGGDTAIVTRPSVRDDYAGFSDIVTASAGDWEYMVARVVVTSVWEERARWVWSRRRISGSDGWEDIARLGSNYNSTTGFEWPEQRLRYINEGLVVHPDGTATLLIQGKHYHPSTYEAFYITGLYRLAEDGVSTLYHHEVEDISRLWRSSMDDLHSNLAGPSSDHLFWFDMLEDENFYLAEYHSGSVIHHALEQNPIGPGRASMAMNEVDGNIEFAIDGGEIRYGTFSPGDPSSFSLSSVTEICDRQGNFVRLILRPVPQGVERHILFSEIKKHDYTDLTTIYHLQLIDGVWQPVTQLAELSPTIAHTINMVFAEQEKPIYFWLQNVTYDEDSFYGEIHSAWPVER